MLNNAMDRLMSCTAAFYGKPVALLNTSPRATIGTRRLLSVAFRLPTVWREEILAAAIKEFARFGLYCTAVDAIADRVGFSQPYIFRLYGTKKDLFIAAALQVCDRIQGAFGDAATAAPDRLKPWGTPTFLCSRAVRSCCCSCRRSLLPRIPR